MIVLLPAWQRELYISLEVRKTPPDAPSPHPTLHPSKHSSRAVATFTTAALAASSTSPASIPSHLAPLFPSRHHCTRTRMTVPLRS